ncbi:hypothetical protein TL16_g01102 [Triparma laevis f. inornata]|uniref:Uncharacterized protein n=1 Tax=Triparma laevis f. inornata TaxID=1714386 RepID=A0A9W7DV49_9STRA|nr:hypothetical protein TL16_g01102 [Triparma laevis f. inornata]
MKPSPSTSFAFLLLLFLALFHIPSTTSSIIRLQLPSGRVVRVNGETVSSVEVLKIIKVRKAVSREPRELR